MASSLTARFVGAKPMLPKRRLAGRVQVSTKAAFVSSGVTTSDLKAAGGRSVVELNGTKILIQVREPASSVSHRAPPKPNKSM